MNLCRASPDSQSVSQEPKKLYDIQLVNVVSQNSRPHTSVAMLSESYVAV